MAVAATELQAGPEMDAEIARRLFGLDDTYVTKPSFELTVDWFDHGPLIQKMAQERAVIQLHADGRTHDDFADPWPPDDALPQCFKDWGYSGIGMWHPMGGEYALPMFSTHIAAAWLVVEKMREMGYSVCVESWIHGGWAAEIIPNEEQFAVHGMGVHSVDDTAPLTICRAALAALEAG